MALLQDLNGERTQIATAATTFAKCYCRVIDGVYVGRESCNIKVEWWLNQVVRNEGGKSPLYVSFYEAPGVSNLEFQSFIQAADGDMIKALYLWLKTQPDFVTAEDA